MEGALRLTAEDRAAELDARAGHLSGSALLAAAAEEFPGRLACVSAFGAESAALLHLVAEVDPSIPIIFLETQKHFPETLMYRDRIAAKLGLKDVRSVKPEPADLEEPDPDGRLWARNPDQCCHLRKVLPLERALSGFDAWITGRKRFQSTTRAELPPVEAADGRVKINPMCDWGKEDVDQLFADTGLPRHPLVHEGYPSIGCLPCTRKPAEDADERDGRWAGSNKTECGIHKVWWLQQQGGDAGDAI